MSMGPLIPMVLEMDICTTEVVCTGTDTMGCTRLRHPVAVSSAEVTNMVTIVSGYGGHTAQGYGSGIGIDHIAYGATGPTFCPQRPAPQYLQRQAQNSSARPAGRYSGGGGYDDLPLGPWYRWCCLWMIWQLRQRGSLWWCFTGTWDGYGGAAPGGALGVEGFNFDDESPQFPAASGILRGESPYSVPSAGRGNGTIGSGAVGTVRRRGTPLVLMSSLGCSPPSALVGVRVMGSVLLARLPRLVVPVGI